MDLLNLIPASTKGRSTVPDPETARLAVERMVGYLPEQLGRLGSDPALEETRVSGVVSSYSAIARLAYGLGAPLEAVREALQFEVHWGRELLRLQGSGEAIEWYQADEEGVRKVHEQRSKGSSSFSQRTYGLALTALICGDRAASKELAGQIWDPPDAGYVGFGKYAVCTPHQQRVAARFREIATGSAGWIPTAGGKGARGPAPTAFDEAQLAVLDAIAAEKGVDVVEHLSTLLRAHEKLAKRSEHCRDPWYFFSTEALGLAVLAVSRGVVERSGLPVSGPFFPWELPNWPTPALV